MAKHYPLIGWSKREIELEIQGCERELVSMRAELARRGDRDEEQYGFPIGIREGNSIVTAYTRYPTREEAYAAAAEQWPNDESAPYRVHPVYLGKDDK